MMPPLSLRAKLVLLCSLAFAAVWGASGVILYEATRTRAAADFDARLVHLCAGLWGYLEFAGNDHLPRLVYNARDHEVVYFVAQASRYYQLYDGETGLLLSQSPDSEMIGLALPPEKVLRLLARPGFDEVTSSKHIFRFRSAIYHFQQYAYLLRVGDSLDDLLMDRSRFLHLLLLFIPLATLVSGASGWWVATRALSPLQELKKAADKININQLERRMPLLGTGDEVEAVAKAFNAALARLELDVRQMKGFAACMSHELRTPLTVLRGETEVALLQPEHEITAKNWRELLTSQLEEFDKLDRLVQRFLFLARAEAGEIEFEMEPFNLGALVAALGREMTPLAMSRGISLSVSCEADATVIANPGWIERAILNLLDNAIKFTAEGGKIQIATRSAGNRAMVEVSDSGSGIAEGDLPHIFDRFYRTSDLGSTRSGGVGLGLSLTKWIIEKHGGVIQASSKAGVGSVFTIILPLARADASQAEAKEPPFSTSTD